MQDSMSAVIQQEIFENQYVPKIKLYANTGLNSTSIPYLGNHFGLSAGVQLTYTLYDGKQRQIKQQQKLILLEQSGKEKQLKVSELNNSRTAYYSAIRSLNASIEKEEELQLNYSEILELYNTELKNAQVSIIEYLDFLQLYNQNKLALENHKIERSKLIVEYNYLNH